MITLTSSFLAVPFSFSFLFTSPNSQLKVLVSSATITRTAGLNKQSFPPPLTFMYELLFCQQDRKNKGKDEPLDSGTLKVRANANTAASVITLAYFLIEKKKLL